MIWLFPSHEKHGIKLRKTCPWNVIEGHEKHVRNFYQCVVAQLLRSVHSTTLEREPRGTKKAETWPLPRPPPST